MIERAMRMAGNVQSRAADILGIGKSGLNQKLKKFQMDSDSGPRDMTDQRPES
jgi:two-component system NtrC family response regulator